MNTLLLDPISWDLILDVNGNIAVAAEPYALAQDAASACRTFLGEVFYDTTMGVNYGAILGKRPSTAFLKAQFVEAALTVPDVATAKCFITGIQGRTVSGQVQITSASGAVAAASLTPPTPSGVPSPLPFGP